ncbi:MAG: hypothetical protein H5T84_01080 [Thermoleophilia bacterium]|nr:hypothetical protein [Thermoleophilia bacterium]
MEERKKNADDEMAAQDSQDEIPPVDREALQEVLKEEDALEHDLAQLEEAAQKLEQIRRQTKRGVDG